jgi:signal transduction histidine kinase/ligand-binding sensor domain-containing protein
MRRLLLQYATALVLLLLPALDAMAQAPRAELTHLTPREGLSDVFVWPILQSADGYMWFGTRAGLDRYDGYEVQRLVHDPDDDSSIRVGSVRSLLEGPDGRIWVGSETGLSILDPGTLTFSNVDIRPGLPLDSLYLLSVWALHRTDDGRIWGGTGLGLFVIAENDPGNVRWYYHDPSDETSIARLRINAIAGGEPGILWLASLDDGLSRFDIRTRNAKTFRRDLARAGSLPDNTVFVVHRDRAGRIWAATERGGLCLFREASETFDCLPYAPATSAGTLPAVQGLMEDADGRLWLATDGAGVRIFDPETRLFSAIVHDPSNPGSLPEDDVHYVYRDRLGTIWFAHHFRGVSRMTPSAAQFETRRLLPGEPASHANHMVMSVTVADDGILWMGTRHGLVRHDAESRQTEVFLPFPDDPVQNTAGEANRNLLTNTLIDRRGRIWAGTRTGRLLRFDPQTRRFDEVLTTPSFEVAPTGIDSDGHIWVLSTGQGVLRIDPETDSLVTFRSDETDPQSLYSDTAIPFPDPRGSVTVASIRLTVMRPMAQRFLPESGSFEFIPFDIPGDIVPSAPFASGNNSGIIWMESPGALFRLESTSARVTAFARSMYNLPPEILTILEDDEGRIWYGNATGAVGVFDPTRGTATSFFAEQGVRLLRVAASTQLPDGRLLFAGTGGYIVFDPKEVFGRGSAPIVRLTSLRAGSEVFDAATIGGRRLNVRHDHGSIAFNFVALHFADPLRNQYRYRLDGFDSDWTQPGTQRSASYANLPPGTYTFHVQAASSEGVWNEEGATLTFTVLAPWWRTWWAMALFGLILVAGVWTVDRVQRRRVISRERERTRELELEHAREIERAYQRLKAAQTQLVQQEKLASLGALTAGVAHEIKNPLNFINNFSQLATELAEELIETGDRNPETQLASVRDILSDIRLNTSKIHEHGARADAIVKSMLQHSRGGTGTRQPADVNALVEEYTGLAYHGRRAQQADFAAEIVLELDPAAGMIPLVAQDIGRVVLNLVVNAFDAVNDRRGTAGPSYRPTVRVATVAGEDWVEVYVEDNGAGIPSEIKARVFEPFFTTKDAGKGTGLGLSLSHEIVVQGHGGTLAVDDAPGGGTRFVIFLPRVKAATGVVEAS